MTNEELKNMLFIIDTLLDDAITDSTRQKVKDKLTEVCKLAMKALEQQPCEDCISRAYIAPIIEELEYDQIDNDYALSLLSDIKNAPSVAPQRPKGKWIDDCGGIKCSCCGYSIDDEHYAKAYCTNCGAEMSGGSEDEV